MKYSAVGGKVGNKRIVVGCRGLKVHTNIFTLTYALISSQMLQNMDDKHIKDDKNHPDSPLLLWHFNLSSFVLMDQSAWPCSVIT